MKKAKFLKLHAEEKVAAIRREQERSEAIDRSLKAAVFLARVHRDLKRLLRHAQLTGRQNIIRRIARLIQDTVSK